MAELKLKQIKKTYEDGPTVIHGVDLHIKDGEFMVFVGPSGCGKSTMMRMIAGLEDITDGEVWIGDRVANHVQPSERGVAMVFQSYALYPHMSVRDNMAFGLKLAGKSKQEINDAVGRAADILQISHLLERKPKALSGGQRQRVAIGRAIVRKPDVFLFDEPLSNLDAALRVQMRIELSRLHKDLGTTMIYVTHDQVEAMTMGDRIAVFNGGRIEQVGTPLELYDQPANLFVAGFLGSPKMNFLPVKAANDNGATSLQLPTGDIITLNGVHASGDLTLGIRPEHLTFAESGMPVTVDLVEHLGDVQIAYVKVAGVEEALAIKLPSQTSSPKNGSVQRVKLDNRFCHLFDAQGQALRRQQH